MIKFSENMKYFRNLETLDLSSIKFFNKDNKIDYRGINELCYNIHYVSNLKRLNISCILLYI